MSETPPIVKTPFRHRNRLNTGGKENSLNREVKELKRKLQDERAKCDDFELEAKNKENIIAKLNADYDLCKTRLHNLNDTLAGMISFEEYDKLKNQFDNLQSKYESCLNDLKFRSDCVKDLEDELKTAYANNSELNAKMDSLMKDMEKVAKEYIDHSQLKCKYQDLTEKSKVIMEENEELRRSLEAYKEANRRDLLNESSIGTPGSKQDSNRGEAEPMSLFTEMMLREREDDNDKLVRSNEALKRENEELKAKLMDTDRLYQENQALNAQKALLMDQVRDLYQDRDGLLSKRNAEKDRLNEKIKELQDKMVEKDADVIRLRNERKKEKKEIEKLKKQIEELESQLKVLDLSFTFERRSKERILRENQHLESMLKEEQMKLNKVSQSASNQLASITSTDSTVTVPRPAHVIEAPRTSHPLASPINDKQRVDEAYVHENGHQNSYQHITKPEQLKSQSQPFQAIKEARVNGHQNEPHNKRQAIVPPGTGRRLPMADEEGEFMNQTHSVLSNQSPNKSQSQQPEVNENPYERFSVLQTRNARVLPHLKSSYPVEFQDVAVPEKAIKEKGPLPLETDLDASYNLNISQPHHREPFTGFFEIPVHDQSTSKRVGPPKKLRTFTVTKAAPTKAPRSTVRPPPVLKKSTTFTIPP